MSGSLDGNLISLDVVRRKRRSETSKCKHERFLIDDEGGTVECADCHENVSAFHALCQIAQADSVYSRKFHTFHEQYQKLKNYKPWLVAVRGLERTWRGKKMLPCCPHCKRGVTAQELSISSVSIEFENAQRRKAAE